MENFKINRLIMCSKFNEISEYMWIVGLIFKGKKIDYYWDTNHVVK